MTLYEFMEDFDNWELSTPKRQEQLMDAVLTYNEENGTDHNPLAAYFSYERQRKQNKE